MSASTEGQGPPPEGDGYNPPPTEGEDVPPGGPSGETLRVEGDASSWW